MNQAIRCIFSHVFAVACLLFAMGFMAEAVTLSGDSCTIRVLGAYGLTAAAVTLQKVKIK